MAEIARAKAIPATIQLKSESSTVPKHSGAVSIWGSLLPKKPDADPIPGDQVHKNPDERDWKQGNRACDSDVIHHADLVIAKAFFFAVGKVRVLRQRFHFKTNPIGIDGKSLGTLHVGGMLAITSNQRPKCGSKQAKLQSFRNCIHGAVSSAGSEGNTMLDDAMGPQL